MYEGNLSNQAQEASRASDVNLSSHSELSDKSIYEKLGWLPFDSVEILLVTVSKA